ncbi:Hypothetical protein Cp106_0013 [Corynebacterium pseudotuberculosis 1/06-A]|nr:Hypothetical protein Cp106_0013 [Corynebacterium pseudotuberculosis 1/06-A]
MLHGMKKTTSKFLEVVFLHEIGFEGMGWGVDTLKTITANYQDAAAEGSRFLKKKPDCGPLPRIPQERA